MVEIRLQKISNAETIQNQFQIRVEIWEFLFDCLYLSRSYLYSTCCDWVEIWHLPLENGDKMDAENFHINHSVIQPFILKLYSRCINSNI